MNNTTDLEEGSSNEREEFQIDADVLPHTIHDMVEEIIAQQGDTITPEQSRLLRSFVSHHPLTQYDSAGLSEGAQEIDYLFRRFVTVQDTQCGLNLQFGSSSTLLLDDSWISVDLAVIEADALRNPDVTLAFADEQFDRVLCLGLDRVSQPASLIAELRRVLKRGGQLWGQAPIGSSLQTGSVRGPLYWGFTPDGLRVLFERFDEILCSVYQASGSISRRDSFFYGLKPQIPT